MKRWLTQSGAVLKRKWGIPPWLSSPSPMASTGLKGACSADRIGLFDLPNGCHNVAGLPLAPPFVQVHQQGNRVFLMGQTTGSHLDLPWREEFQDKVIWIADVKGDRISLWKILGDTEENRRAYAIPA